MAKDVVLMTIQKTFEFIEMKFPKLSHLWFKNDVCAEAAQYIPTFDC